jgi:hypothetical protein
MTNGTISKGANGYIVKPEKVGVEANVTVSAMIDGKPQLIGSAPFRVKKAPDPVASVAGKIEGSISLDELTANDGILAKIPDFDFELKFTVTSFTVSTTVGGFVKDRATTGNRFSAEQKQLISGLRNGNRVYFENIVVKGEDGSTRRLPNIGFKIN